MCLSGSAMPLMLPAFLLIIMGTPSSPMSLPPEYSSDYDETRDALREMRIPYHKSADAHGTPCQRDEECSSGQVCAWGKCAESVRTESGGTRCDPAEESCAPGFCCYKAEALPFPVCQPLPTRGKQCQNQISDLVKWFAAGDDFSLGSCPCAEGLVCASTGNLISTCEKPEEVIDFTNYREESIFPPMVHRDEESTYANAELLPWPPQDDQLALIDLPRAVEGSQRAMRNAINMGDNLEDESLHFDNPVPEPPDLSQVDFQELKQLANDMGQYFEPGFY